MPNYASISEKVSQSVKVKNEIYHRATEKTEKAQNKLLEDFNNHEITKEISAGPGADNSSHTLPGLSSHGGNLFSFIGFYAGDDPIEPIRQILETEIRVIPKPQTSVYKSSHSIKYKFLVEYPSLEDFDKVAEYPDGWRDGSWLYGIEHGIFGLSYYLYDEEFGTYEQSRSQTALEAKNAGNLVVVRGNSQSTPSQYLSALLRQFERNLKR